jgi:hypothetical protein
MNKNEVLREEEEEEEEEGGLYLLSKTDSLIIARRT